MRHRARRDNYTTNSQRRMPVPKDERFRIEMVSSTGNTDFYGILRYSAPHALDSGWLLTYLRVDFAQLVVLLF